MPEWVVQLFGPMAGGLVAGLVAFGSIKSEIKALHESSMRAHVRLDDHIERHRMGAVHGG